MFVHSPPEFSIPDLLAGINPEKFLVVSPTDERGRYLHWDDIRHRQVPPPFADRREYWRYIKLARGAKSVELPFLDTRGRRFICCPAALEASVFMFDRRAAGGIGANTTDAMEPQNLYRYVASGLMNEAIHSSQLEGASTTYARAKEMLQKKQRPKDHGERMIFNNYNAMRFIVEDFKNRAFSAEALCELHSIITDKTLKKPQDGGRWRNCDADDTNFGVYYNDKIIFRPPAWGELRARMSALAEFANTPPQNAKPFIHPALRAMILHFMVAYNHPFIDGNGRTARAAYYWAMLKNGYWLAPYAPISDAIKRSSRAYMRAFLLAETDAGMGNTVDMTYFLDYHTRVALNALQHLYKRIERGGELQRARRQLAERLPASEQWNERQTELLQHALRKPNEEYTAAMHARRHAVSKPTALADLARLEKAGFLRRRRAGKNFVFVGATDLPERLSPRGKPERGGLGDEPAHIKGGDNDIQAKDEGD